MQPEPPAGGSPDGPGGAPPGGPRGNRMLRPPHSSRIRHPVWYALVNGAEQVEREAADSVRDLPAWRRRTPGEQRWPVTICVILAIVLQLLLPHQLTMPPLPHY